MLENKVYRGKIGYEDYRKFVRWINHSYTNVMRGVGVLGPKMASSANNYFRYTNKNINKRAAWEKGLTYDTMLSKIQDMLDDDIPVVFSVGPNTPKLWGDIKINMYKQLKKGEEGYSNYFTTKF